MKIDRSALAAIVLLAASFFLGAAAILVTPPFEGADETAHYSYIQQLADTGHAPVPGKDGLSRDLDRYEGPMRYNDSAPFEATGKATYRRFRLHPSALTAAPTHYTPSDTLNWEAQHPPLYYQLMAPIYAMTAWAPFAHGLMVMRFSSWIMAWSGLALATLACLCSKETMVSAAAPFIAAWPFLVPQFVPAFARLGNDSYCLLVVGALFAALADINQRWRWVGAAALGFLLSQGLQTKAFFLPIGVGLCAFLVYRGWRDGKTGAGLGEAAIVAAIAALLGGGWYLKSFGVTHDLTSGADFVALQKSGGLVAGLERNFSLAALARGLAALAATFGWTGTWSLARPPEALIVFSLAPFLVALAGYFASLRSQAASALSASPLFLVAPMLAGLLYHVLVFVALTGRGASTPGYYLHILAPFLALAVAIGWDRWRSTPWLLVPLGVFTLYAWAMQLSMFSGCATKMGDDPHYSFTGAGCFLDAGSLQRLGQPVAAACAAGLAAGLLILALVMVRPKPKAGAETSDEPVAW